MQYPSFDDKELNAFLNIWLDCQRDSAGGIPNRDAFSLRRLGVLAPNTYFMELDNDGELKFALSGTGIDDMFQQNLVKQRFSELSSDLDYKAVRYFHREPMVHHCGGYHRDILTLNDGQKVTYSNLVLPLQAQDDNLVGRDICFLKIESSADFIDFDGLLQQVKNRVVVDAFFFDLGYGAPEMKGLHVAKAEADDLTGF